jgi:hypothetical protein
LRIRLPIWRNAAASASLCAAASRSFSSLSRACSAAAAAAACWASSRWRQRLGRGAGGLLLPQLLLCDPGLVLGDHLVPARERSFRLLRQLGRRIRRHRPPAPCQLLERRGEQVVMGTLAVALQRSHNGLHFRALLLLVALPGEELLALALQNLVDALVVAAAHLLDERAQLLDILDGTSGLLAHPGGRALGDQTGEARSVTAGERRLQLLFIARGCLHAGRVLSLGLLGGCGGALGGDLGSWVGRRLA